MQLHVVVAVVVVEGRSQFNLIHQESEAFKHLLFLVLAAF